MRRNRAGFQLAELLISIMIFSIVVGICFYAAAAGFRIFAHTNSRQSLQRDTRAIFAWLQRDMGLSNLVLCRRQRRDIDSNRRDILGVVALDEWQHPITTDSLGLPVWNRVVVYQADSTRSILGRQVYVATPNTIPAILQDLTNGTVGTYFPTDQRRLSNSLKSFAVELADDRNTAVFDLMLSEATVDGSSGRARNEVLQVQTTIFPRNTWPRL